MSVGFLQCHTYFEKNVTLLMSDGTDDRVGFIC